MYWVRRYYKAIGAAVHGLSINDPGHEWSWENGGIESIILHRGGVACAQIDLRISGREMWFSAELPADMIDDNPVVTIGSESWTDVKTIEDGIPMILELVARIVKLKSGRR